MEGLLYSDENSNATDWCNISPSCKPNSSDSDCSQPFCPYILTYSINDTSVRVYDLILLFCSVIFLGYLLVRLVATVKKLYDSFPLFRLLYFMMFLIPIMSCAYEITSLATGYKSKYTKAMHVFLRGSILMSELSVVIFGIFIKLCGNSKTKLATTVSAIVGVSIAYTIVEGVLEFKVRNAQLACESYKLFTHGGMVFLFSTSVVFAVAYAVIFLVYILNLYRRWDLPTKKSFYRYALFLSLVNVLQAVGSVLWFTGKNHPVSGNTGICLTAITNIIYVATFAPVVYWIFLSNYFRMNTALIMKSVEVSGKINDDAPSSMEASHRKRGRKSNPLDIGRTGRLFGDYTSLIAESYDTSSSYGSLDEETFTRRQISDS